MFHLRHFLLWYMSSMMTSWHQYHYNLLRWVDKGIWSLSALPCTVPAQYAWIWERRIRVFGKGMQGFIRIEIWCIIHFEMDFLLQPICSFKMFPMKKKNNLRWLRWSLYVTWVWTWRLPFFLIKTDTKIDAWYRFEADTVLEQKGFRNVLSIHHQNS